MFRRGRKKGAAAPAAPSPSSRGVKGGNNNYTEGTSAAAEAAEIEEEEYHNFSRSPNNRATAPSSDFGRSKSSPRRYSASALADGRNYSGATDRQHRQQGQKGQRRSNSYVMPPNAIHTTPEFQMNPRSVVSGGMESSYNLSTNMNMGYDFGNDGAASEVSALTDPHWDINGIPKGRQQAPHFQRGAQRDRTRTQSFVSSNAAHAPYKHSRSAGRTADAPQGGLSGAAAPAAAAAAAAVNPESGIPPRLTVNAKVLAPDADGLDVLPDRAAIIEQLSFSVKIGTPYLRGGHYLYPITTSSECRPLCARCHLAGRGFLFFFSFSF